jgi:hypothetical protein
MLTSTNYTTPPGGKVRLLLTNSIPTRILPESIRLSSEVLILILGCSGFLPAPSNGRAQISWFAKVFKLTAQLL